MSKSKKKSRAAAAVAGEPFFADQAKEDRVWWRKANPRMLARIDALIEDIRRHPFTGIGKPEPLKYDWQGYWSRRVTDEHRIVYRVEAGRLYILQLRYHY